MGPKTPENLSVNSKNPKYSATFFSGTSSTNFGREAVEIMPRAIPPMLPIIVKPVKLSIFNKRIITIIHKNPADISTFLAPIAFKLLIKKYAKVIS